MQRLRQQKKCLHQQKAASVIELCEQNQEPTNKKISLIDPLQNNFLIIY